MPMPARPGERIECTKVNGVLSLVGDRWSVLTLMTLRPEARRFNDLKRSVGGVSQQMLTRTLRSLEQDGLVSRTVFATTPPQVEYALTDLGRSLAEPLGQLVDWAKAHMVEIERHRERAHPSLEARLEGV